DPDSYDNGNPRKLKVLICPKDPYTGDSNNAPRSYLMTDTLSGGNFLYAGTSGTSTYPAPVPLRTDAVPVPAGTFPLVEMPNYASGRGRQGGSIDPKSGPWSQSSRIAGVNIAGTVYIAATATGVTTHPMDRFNYVYADNHVSRLQPLNTDLRPGVLCS